MSDAKKLPKWFAVTSDDDRSMLSDGPVDPDLIDIIIYGEEHAYAAATLAAELNSVEALRETNAALLAALKELFRTASGGAPGFNSAYRAAQDAIKNAEGR